MIPSIVDSTEFADAVNWSLIILDDDDDVRSFSVKTMSSNIMFFGCSLTFSRRRSINNGKKREKRFISFKQFLEE